MERKALAEAGLKVLDVALGFMGLGFMGLGVHGFRGLGVKG